MKNYIIPHPTYPYILFLYNVILILFQPFESEQIYDYNESDHFVTSKAKPIKASTGFSWYSSSWNAATIL